MADNTFTSSRGGRSKYCCVPGCKSSFYNNQGEKTNISFFLFLWRQKVGIGGFWQLKDKKTETDLL